MSENSIQAFDPGLGRDMLQNLTAVAREYHDDPDFRAQLEADPRAMLEARQLRVVPEDAEVQVHVNTPEVFHLVMADNPNAAVSDIYLSQVAGGSSASSVGSASTVGTVSTVPSCVGCAGTVGSAGSGGCATGS